LGGFILAIAGLAGLESLFPFEQNGRQRKFMDSVDLQVLRSSVAWLGEGHRVILATIVETWGSSPRPAGAMLAVRGDGLVAGSVSGGCVEDDLIFRIRNKSLAVEKPEIATYGISKDEATRY
jgi:xanthine dehydrogenase accessory factor